MQAVLFPFTYISEAVCEALGACFQPIRIYPPTRRRLPLPMQAMSEKGLIDLAMPAEQDEKKIEILTKDYHNWAEMHRGGVPDYLKQQVGSVPFFDDTAVAQIKTEITRTAAGTSPPYNSLLNARVFLQIAQEYDIESEEIAQKLVSTSRAEKKLFMNITGESDVSAQRPWRPQTTQGADSTGYMIQTRIRMWARLFLQDRAFDPTGAPTAFVTVNREAIDFLREQAPPAAPILKVASLPVINHLSEAYDNWQNEFSRILDQLPENADAMAADLIARFQRTDPASPQADLTLYRVPGASPAVFFGRFSGQPLVGAEKKWSQKQDQTILGLVEIRPEKNNKKA